MTDTATIAGAALLAAGGFLALYWRISHEFDRSTTALTLSVIAGATPVLSALLQGSFGDLAWFAALSAVMLVASRMSRRSMRLGMLLSAVAAVMFVAPAPTERPTLFSPHNGFLALTPVLYIATVVAVACLRSHLEEGAAAAMALLLWPLAHVSLVPAVALLAPPLAVAIDCARRRPLVAVAPLVGALIIWNYWLMVQYTAGTIPKDAPVSFAAMVRQQADVHTRQPFVYLFAFPGNLIAAWREGIPLGRYDLLASESPREVFEIRLDRSADRFLLDGWGALATNAGGSYRPLAGPATLLMPLRLPTNSVQLHVQAAVRGSNAPRPDDETTVLINDQEVGRLFVGNGSAESRLHLDSDVVGRVFHAGYNRLTLVPPSRVPIIVYGVRLGPAE
jgi:hypothetical protein